MGRKSEVQSTNSNPSQKFVEWSSKNKCFEYYDREAKEKKLLKLPFTFLYLAERTTIKGFDGEDETGIYSNEVKYLSEPLEVKNFKKRKIANGLWDDIKSDVTNRGGKFAKSIYAMTKKGTLINVTLYGGAIGEWFAFTEKSKKRLTDEWITVSDFEERKKFGNIFFVPIFRYNKSLSDDEGKLADKAYAIFEEFEKEPTPRKLEADSYVQENLEPIKTETGETYDNDDLAF